MMRQRIATQIMEPKPGAASEPKYDGVRLTKIGLDTQKKTFGAIERDEVERLLFRDVIRTLKVEKVAVVDESSTHLGMTHSMLAHHAVNVPMPNLGVIMGKT